MAERCTICGEPMPEGEEMFQFHGYSGPCPKPPLPKPGDEIPFTGADGKKMKYVLLHDSAGQVKSWKSVCFTHYSIAVVPA